MFLYAHSIEGAWNARVYLPAVPCTLGSSVGVGGVAVTVTVHVSSLPLLAAFTVVVPSFIALTEQVAPLGVISAMVLSAIVHVTSPVALEAVIVPIPLTERLIVVGVIVKSAVGVGAGVSFLQDTPATTKPKRRANETNLFFIF